jgi:hypothetical protein
MGYTDRQISTKIIDLFKESVEDEDDCIIIYSALAAIQLSRSSLFMDIKERTISLIENESSLGRWKEGGKVNYKNRLKELDKLKRILSMAKVVQAEVDEENITINEMISEPLLYSVYELTDSSGNVKYIGSTAFPEKRFRYMNYIEFKKDKAFKGFFGLLGSSKTKEEEFWEWFSKVELNIFNAENINDIHVQELFKKIKNVHPKLTIEFSPEVDGKKTMAISADGISEFFPYVIKLVNEPKLVSKWIVLPFRQRLRKINNIEIKLGDIAINCNNIFFVSEKNGRHMDLEIYIKDIDNVDNVVINAVFLLLDSTIGEYAVVSKIGRVDVKPFSTLKDSGRAQELYELPTIVDKMN